MSESPAGESFSWKAADITSDNLLRREWIVTNGLGGFASAAITGALTRRYQGLLVAALPIPHGRVVMLTNLRERLHLAGEPPLLLSAQPGLEEAAEADGEMFRENGLPVWRFKAGGAIVEKRLVMPHQQNTVFISYTLVSDTPKAHLELRPLLRFRHLEAAVDKGWETPYRFSVKGEEYEISHPDLPPLCISLCSPGKGFQIAEEMVRGLRYATEEERGEPCLGDLWSPGFFSLELRKGETVTLMASTEPTETRDALNPRQAREYELRRRMRLLERAPAPARTGFAAELVLAADQFLIEPAGRAGEAALAQAQGDDVRTVIAGYHWFTDWGRDTMISLEGLALDTGRPARGRAASCAPSRAMCATGSSRTCSRRARAAGSTTRRMRPSGFSTRSRATSRARTTAPRCGSCCRCWRISWSTTCAARISTSTWTRRMRCSSRASRAIS